MLNCATFMENTFCRKVGIVRLIRILKEPKHSLSAIKENLRNPFFITFAPRHTKQSRAFIVGLCFFLILKVFRSGYIAKIGKNVVSFVPVYVVNVLLWPFASHIKPRKTHPELALEFDNLQVLCADCNKRKGNKHSIDYRTLAKNKGEARVNPNTQSSPLKVQ